MGQPRNWKLEDLPAAVQQSKSWTGVCVVLGLKTNNSARLKEQATNLGLNTDHFTAEWQGRHKLPDAEIFCEDSKHRWAAKNRFRARTPEICMLCAQKPFWNGKLLRFEIDHKNGDGLDCRWDNLQKVCPNCHSQTDTYCGRNRVVTDGSRAKLNGETIWCNACQHWLEPDAFGNKRSMPNGKQSNCKGCLRLAKGASNGA